MVANSGLFLLLMRSGWELPLRRACAGSVVVPLVCTAVRGRLLCHEPGARGGALST